MAGLKDHRGEVAAAIAGALAAWDASPRAATAYSAGGSTTAASPTAAAAPAYGPQQVPQSHSWWTLAWRQITMGQANWAYERRRGRQK